MSSDIASHEHYRFIDIHILFVANYFIIVSPQFDFCRFILKQQIPSMRNGRVPGLSQLSGMFLHLFYSVSSATYGLHLRAPNGMLTDLLKI